LSALASALVVAEQNERERISQILHDDLQQMLFASQMRVTLLKAGIEDLGNENLGEQVREIESLYDGAITVARSLTVELSPPVLEGDGLVEAFGWLATQMESSYNLTVTVNVNNELDFENHDLYDLVFQVTRELLFNVVKHAETETAQISMEKHNDLCRISIIDEGIGFDPASMDEPAEGSSSYGLSRIRERLTLFDGFLDVDSAPGKGTTVVIGLPCSYVRSALLAGE
jgi:signal transduction histidine kinase